MPPAPITVRIILFTVLLATPQISGDEINEEQQQLPKTSQCNTYLLEVKFLFKAKAAVSFCNQQSLAISLG